MVRVTLYQGEARLLPFRIKDPKTGRPKNLSGASFALWVKAEEDLEPIIVKTNSDFDKSGVTNGYVTCFLQAQESIQEPGVYPAQLRITTGDTPPEIMKLSLELEILEDVVPNDWTVEAIGIVSLEAFGDTWVSQ
jgi:hypothetical protein